MKYDSTQFNMDLTALKHNREVTKEQHLKICGAIEIVEAMLKNCLEQEAKDREEPELNAEPLMEPSPEEVQDITGAMSSYPLLLRLFIIPSIVFLLHLLSIVTKLYGHHDLCYSYPSDNRE